MSSQKQIAANRRNGRKSRGPRTAAGKSVSSRNALRHGLASISRHNPAFAPRIEAIARAICADTINPGLWEQVLIIGECTTVLGCVQAERIALLELGGTSARITDGEGVARAELGASRSKPALPRDELEDTLLAARDLDRLERYERRALSRRRRATERFIAISDTLQSPAHPEVQRARESHLELMQDGYTTSFQFLHRGTDDLAARSARACARGRGAGPHLQAFDRVQVAYPERRPRCS